MQTKFITFSDDIRTILTLQFSLNTTAMILTFGIEYHRKQ